MMNLPQSRSNRRSSTESGTIRSSRQPSVKWNGYFGTATYITAKWVFDLKEEDVYWCTADIGWITGHSYIVYGPLQNGATCLMYEGAPIYPEPDRCWQMIDRHKVSVFYTAPRSEEHTSEL